MKQWYKIISWFILLSCVIVIFYFADTLDKNKIVDTPKIAIEYQGENVLLTEKELLSRLTQKQLLFDGQKVHELNIPGLEKALNEMPEVRSANVFREIGSAWNIQLELRKPIARIFNKYGESFYIDSDGVLMNRLDLHVARTVVFSGNIKDKFFKGNIKDIINNDYLKSIKILDDIYRISSYVCNDLLLYHLIAQVHIDDAGNFLLIPIADGVTIYFGKADSDQQVADKFERLKIVYRHGLPYEGWNKYEEINLSYDGQIVCRKRNE